MNVNLGYSGKARFSLYRGGKCIKSVINHNDGAMELFKYIGACLTGNFSEAQQIGKPFRIKLYADKNFTMPITSMITSREDSAYFPYASTSGDVEKGYVMVKIDFTIPSIFITDKTAKQIAGARLYPKNADDSRILNEDYCASISFKDNQDKLLLPADRNQDVTIKVQWYLTIGNVSQTSQAIQAEQDSQEGDS